MRTEVIKVLCSIIISLHATFAISQVEPQFKFYLAFEDATGQRDTVWLIVDSNATALEDTIFNENLYPIDSNNFDVYFGLFSTGIGDSARNVFAQNKEAELFGGFINAVNFTHPTIVRWDTNLLKNHALNNPFRNAYISTDNYIPGYYYLYDTLSMNPGSVSSGIIDSIILLEQFYHFPITLTISRNPINTIGISPPKTVLNHVVYPNPCYDEFKVSSQTWPIDFIIYDLMGRKVSRGTLKRETDTFSVSQFSRGTYIVRLNSDDESWTQRLVVD